MVFRLNSSRGTGRQLARCQAPSIVLTALEGEGGTQRAVESGLASPYLR